MDIARKLEVHYYFDDESHSMDAHIRNKCEAELLALIKEVSSISGIEINLDAEALREGGLKNVWQFLGDNGVQTTTIIAIISLIIQLVQYSDSSDEMDLELKKLSIEEKKLSIQKLNKELNEGQPSTQTIKEAAQSINNDFKVLTRKSNFYKQLDNYKKIKRIGFNSLNLDDNPINQESVIDRKNFYKYILSTDKLPDVVIEDAEIEIVSPVIVEGGYKWKGIYQEKPISFNMKDVDFKDDVLSKRISFQHGAKIYCVLNISYALDSTGEIETRGHSVITVIKKVDGELIHETPQGKRYKFEKKQREGQKDLF